MYLIRQKGAYTYGNSDAVARMRLNKLLNIVREDDTTVTMVTVGLLPRHILVS